MCPIPNYGLLRYYHADSTNNKSHLIYYYIRLTFTIVCSSYAFQATYAFILILYYIYYIIYRCMSAVIIIRISFFTIRPPHVFTSTSSFIILSFTIPRWFIIICWFNIICSFFIIYWFNIIRSYTLLYVHLMLYAHHISFKWYAHLTLYAQVSMPDFL